MVLCLVGDSVANTLGWSSKFWLLTLSKVHYILVRKEDTNAARLSPK